MPQLKSGRHVALSASPYLDALTSGPSETKYFAIVALRTSAATPEALRDHLVVGYFLESGGTPPNSPSFDSGYCVADVLEGRSDWSPDEVEEFRAFLTNEPRFGPWLQAQFDELSQAIHDNAAWESDLLENDVASNDIDVFTIKRVIIQKSAMEAGAMAQLRAPKRDS